MIFIVTESPGPAVSSDTSNVKDADATDVHNNKLKTTKKRNTFSKHILTNHHDVIDSRIKVVQKSQQIESASGKSRVTSPSIVIMLLI